MASPPSMLCLRGTSGIETFVQDQQGGNIWQKTDAVGPDEKSKNCKCFCFSPCGSFFAWGNGENVHVARSDASFSKPAVSLPLPKVSFLCFSPSGSVLATWEVFAIKQGQEAKPNLNLWDTSSGRHLAGFIQKKASGWQPQWTADETLCFMRSPNNEIVSYRDGNFGSVDKRLSIAKLDSFSASPHGTKAYPIVCFIPGQKGGPGFGKLFVYPNFNAEKDVVANKSFFQSDTMEVEWSHDGRHALLLTQSEVDKTGSSYYGKQQLHYINCTGDTALVQLAKEGPIYSIKWNPTRAEFCVIYGYMPAKATIYNSKCDKVFDFGTGSRNMALYNPQGNMLLLGGFGNLRGGIEIWSVKDHKQVSKFDAADSTDIRWSPSGRNLMTSTCAPRLRMGNGFRIWHYSSALLHETLFEDNGKDELWEVTWRSDPKAAAEPFDVSYAKVQGIQPKKAQASKVAYVPPSLRNKAKPGATFKNLEDDEPAENAKSGADGNKQLSKSALKNKKRRENAKNKAAAGGPTTSTPAAATSGPSHVQQQAAPSPAPGGGAGGGGNPETEKQLRKLTQKLKQIEDLKKKQSEGKQLELNQLEKLKTEQALVDQIKQLQLQA